MLKVIKEVEKKDKYRVTNWSDYNNKSLVSRGDITIWFDEDSLSEWFDDGPKQKGAQYVYSDKCIECLSGIKSVFRLAYRQLGVGKSIAKLMGFETDIIPGHTRICRRSVDVTVDICLPEAGVPIYVAVGSTGLKVYGEGEWKTRKHGISKRRTWCKLHLGVDEKTSFIHAGVLTENGKDRGDSQQVGDLLEEVRAPVDKSSGDGAYDTYEIWNLLKGAGIEGIIPPQENANYWTDKEGNLLDPDRNDILEHIDRNGRREWKKKSGYHRRSLSETAMFRFKTIFGSTLYSRDLKKQKTEAKIKVRCLNKMTAKGMPISGKIAA